MVLSKLMLHLLQDGCDRFSIGILAPTASEAGARNDIGSHMAAGLNYSS